MKKNNLPKYWCVKNDFSKRFKETVIEYLNEEYRQSWDGFMYNYYGFDGNVSFGGTSAENEYRYFKNSPVLLSLDEFIELSKEVDDFVLPEKWCVKTTVETRKIVGDFLKNKGYRGGEFFSDYYCHYPFINNAIGASAYSSIKGGYTEITFEQFKKHVLKDMEKEIVGYKLNGKVTAEEAAKALRCMDFVDDYGCFFNARHFSGSTFKFAKKTGLLDLWFEPVYESKPTITIKGYASIVTDNSVKFGCQEYSADFVRTLAKCLIDNDLNMDYKNEVIELAAYFSK